MRSEGRALNEVTRWIEPRLVGVPASLKERILGAVSGERGASPDLAAVFRSAGDRLLHQVLSAPASRDTALTLLAADALMTFACEAMAESHPERLGHVSRV